jgi:hypothetical protein
VGGLVRKSQRIWVWEVSDLGDATDTTLRPSTTAGTSVLLTNFRRVIYTLGDEVLTEPSSENTRFAL